MFNFFQGFEWHDIVVSEHVSKIDDIVYEKKSLALLIKENQKF